MQFTASDLEQLQAKGIAPERVLSQLQSFTDGFPYLTLAGAAEVGNGIRLLDPADRQAAVARWRQYLNDGGEVVKFVPASGAASRMFKDLFAFADGDTDTPKAGGVADQVLQGLDRLPFRAELDTACVKMYGADAAALAAEGRNRDIVAAIIRAEGMNYGALPKAVLTFHRYADGSTRTALEEQFAEGAQTAASNGVVRVHFTVSADHRQLFTDMIAKVQPEMERKFGVKYLVSMSEQKPSTDTVAANDDNTAFRTDDGRLVFRPGGHGALIENLNDLGAQVVFIKNIDNVVPDSYRADTVEYKEVLAGTLVLAHDAAQRHLAALRSAQPSEADIRAALDFVTNDLCTYIPEPDSMTPEALVQLLVAKLDRPLRVCGMVRNEGEPGGGPYIAFNPDGTASPQILESSQIDTADPRAAQMMAGATHFNPVDLVCWLRDGQGNNYDLPAHVDPATGFISSKSLAGRTLKALELPGLWNGAMSDWSTIFVEVPATTFNPVKTVADLLRPAHQG